MSSAQHPAEIPRRHTHSSHQSSFISRFSRKKHRADTMYSGTSSQSQDTNIPSLVYDHYSSYEITWDTLKTFLQRKWPDRRFPDDGEKKGDRWVFEVPERLTTRDRNELAALRDVNQQSAQRRASISDSEG